MTERRTEDLSVVNTDNRTNHLGNDNHISQVSLDDGRLVTGRSILLRLSELLDEGHGLSLESPLESSSSSSVNKLHELSSVQVEELIKLIQRVSVAL